MYLIDYLRALSTGHNYVVSQRNLEMLKYFQNLPREYIYREDIWIIVIIAVI
jgi:hypothetical protein